MTTNSIITLFSFTVFALATICSVVIARRYYYMINGSLRVIMVMTYGAIAWSTMLWCATLLLIRAGVFEAMPPKVEVVSIVAGVPLLVMIFIKYYYIKHNQIKMEE